MPFRRRFPFTSVLAPHRLLARRGCWVAGAPNAPGVAAAPKRPPAAGVGDPNAGAEAAPPPKRPPPPGAGLEAAPNKPPPPGAGLEAAPNKPPPPGAGLEAAPNKPPPPGAGLEAAPNKPPPPGAGLEAAPNKPPPPGAGLEAAPNKPPAVDAAGAAPNKAGVDAGVAAPSPPIPPPKSPPPDGVAPGVCAPGSPGVCPPGAGSAAGAGAFEPGRPAGGAEANPGLSAIAESRAYSASAASASAKGSLCSPRRRSAARCSALARRTFSCRRARSPPTLLKYLCAPSTAALSSAGPAPEASNATPPNSSPPSLERPASRDPV
jgi:hypothetical protein